MKESAILVKVSQASRLLRPFVFKGSHVNRLAPWINVTPGPLALGIAAVAGGLYLDQTVLIILGAYWLGVSQATIYPIWRRMPPAEKASSAEMYRKLRLHNGWPLAPIATTLLVVIEVFSHLIGLPKIH